MMYNLNVNVSTAAAASAVNNLLTVESACTTPRTPEILNSLIAMTNPLDSYNFNNGSCNNTAVSASSAAAAAAAAAAASAAAKESHCLNSTDSNSSGCSQLESPTTPLSVQHTCSQLIKAGLKLSIESKRKMSTEPEDLVDLDVAAKKMKKAEVTNDDDDRSRSPGHGLTPEDEERRRRRRERNKIAATKCRLKKREKTVNLIHESEVLETQNFDLKSQIQELETQRRQLVDMLSMHTPSCMKQPSAAARQPDFHTNGRYLVNEEAADATLPSLMAPYDTPDDFGDDMSFAQHPEMQFVKPSSLVDNVGLDAGYQPSSQLTNMDNPDSPYHFTGRQCHTYSPTGSSQSYDSGCLA